MNIQTNTIASDNAGKVYLNPKKLTAGQILDLNEAYKKHGGVLRQVSFTTGIHYDTVYKFFKRKFKHADESRSDKGIPRSFKGMSPKKVADLKQTFEILLSRDCQNKVALALEKTEMNTGIKIPQRLAYAWAAAFKPVHLRKHQPKQLLLQKGMHIIRDQWAEFENFNDCVYADEWKVDEFGVWVHSKDDDYERSRAVAYIVAFVDAKTRKPEIVITQNSVTTADTIKAALNWVVKYGRPKKFIFENAKTWKNEAFLRFIQGLYDDNNLGMEFWGYNELMTAETTGGDVGRSIPGNPKGKGIVERLFRIIKDEFCAFSESYSPNPAQSRKPELNSTGPGVTRTFEELRRHLSAYMANDFLDRKRTSFYNGMLALSHEDNKSRPETIRQAFEQCYATYNPYRVDEFRLAYLAADKYKRKLRGFQFEFIYPVSKERMIYIPDETEKMLSYMDKEVVLLVNQYNVYKGWFFDTKRNLICGCTDIRLKGAVSKDQANVLGKANNELLVITKKRIKALEKVAKEKGVYTFSYEKTFPDAVEGKMENGKWEMENVSEPSEDFSSDIFDDDSIFTN